MHWMATIENVDTSEVVNDVLFFMYELSHAD